MTLYGTWVTLRGRVREALFPEFSQLRDALRISQAKIAALEAEVRWRRQQQEER